MPKILPFDLPFDPPCGYPGCKNKVTSQVLFGDRHRRAAACAAHAKDAKALEIIRGETSPD